MLRLFSLLLFALTFSGGLRADTSPYLTAYSSPSSSHNAQLLLTPASTLKLVTATTAIKALGADYRFSTRLQFKNAEQGLVARLVLSGDPSFSSDNLYQLLHPLAAEKATVQKLTIDLSTFKGHSRSTGQVWNDIGICFAAPVTAANIDGNCVNGNLKPGKLGGVARLHMADSSLLKIDNQVMTVSAEQSEFCEVDLVVGDNNRYQLKGCISQSEATLPLRFSISDERTYFIAKLKHQLRRLGLKVNNIEFAASEQQAWPSAKVAEHQSPTLLDLIEEMLVESDNLIADSIFKAQGREQKGWGSYQAATQVSYEQLAVLGLDTRYMHIVDGSGLSRENLISAQTLYHLLQTWLIDPELKPLVERLALAGQTGTLRYRASVRKAPLKGKVYAKSGYLTGVVNLAGFVTTNEGYQPFVYLNTGVALDQQTRQQVRERRIMHPVLKAEQQWLLEQLN